MTTANSRVRLIFIRHGQSEANKVFELICGQSISSELSSLGREQAILLGKRLKYQKLNFDYILCSTAMRAKQTAELALKLTDMDLSKLVLSDALLEQSQGDWEGKNRYLCYSADIMTQMNDLHIEFTPPNGESIRMVQKRAVNFLKPYIEQAKQRSIEETREISIAIFGHANCIRSIIQYYLELNPKYTWLIGQQNTAMSEILFNEHGTALVKVNDAAHLTFPIPGSSEEN
ncbi:unnamed protein product [Adineta ricciae]|uniref:Phosphoglycerate mutase n=1 Tax=Adineta ricciae TaxID=249248 RepID=A0A813S290_ADIRI|nr:unnamed protein product [Adineta ricciae]